MPVAVCLKNFHGLIAFASVVLRDFEQCGKSVRVRCQLQRGHRFIEFIDGFAVEVEKAPTFVTQGGSIIPRLA